MVRSAVFTRFADLASYRSLIALLLSVDLVKRKRVEKMKKSIGITDRHLIFYTNDVYSLHFLRFLKNSFLCYILLQLSLLKARVCNFPHAFVHLYQLPFMRLQALKKHIRDSPYPNQRLGTVLI